LVRALLLNASFEPLCVLSARRAVVLVIKEKAEILERTDEAMHSERMAIPVPSVIRLRKFVRVPYRSQVPLSRRAVFARDGHRCQYCSAAAENIDHVLPRSRGGGHTWDNVVAACRSCNSRKEDRLPAEAGLALHQAPRAPHASVWLLSTAGSVLPIWERYLPALADAVPA
jgi:5-methylcytosine-specific restriction endonuclease McrA